MTVTGLLGAADRGPGAGAADRTAEAVLDAALRQFELFGLARATMDDIAARAKLARVTIYRRFPGKDRLVEAVILRELRRFLAELETNLDAIADPEEKVVEGFAYTVRAVRRHTLLQRLLEAEPEVLLPHLTTDGAPFVAAASDFLAARLGAELAAGRGRRELRTVAELVVRLILSFLLTPQSAVDLEDPAQARAFARRYLAPILTGATPARPR